MKKSKLVATLGYLMGIVVATSAHAYTTHFGQDLNNSASNLPISVANSMAAQGAFLSKMTGVRTENFENSPVGTGAGSSGLGITFTGAGVNSLTATLQGNGVVQSNSFFSNLGRYSIPGGSRYWEANLTDGSFSINFGSAIAAFGFFGTDIGDFGAQAIVEIYNGSSLLRSLTIQSTVSTPTAPVDGTALYFGFIAENTNELFTSIKFKSASASVNDVFGFDGFTIAEAAQLTTPLTPSGTAPEPTSLALAGLALAAAGLVARRRKN